MIFKDVHLQGIKSGAISLAFRRWGKTAVKSGSLLKTNIGMVEIIDVEIIDETEISELDAKSAGFESKHLLLKSLMQTENGTIYKISVRFHSEDPRIELREQSVITDAEFYRIKNNLNKLDVNGKHGAWTKKILLIIKNNPERKSTEIATLTGFEKEWLKLNIRKLKNLGLTISHNSGYELSPLGIVFFEKLGNE